jgi:hypothetical protein
MCNLARMSAHWITCLASIVVIPRLTTLSRSQRSR